jgi:hypothetical protein
METVQVEKASIFRTSIDFLVGFPLPCVVHEPVHEDFTVFFWRMPMAVLFARWLTGPGYLSVPCPVLNNRPDVTGC